MTQTSAIRRLKHETGLSIVTCTNAVRAMPKHKDGKRFKVYAQDVQAFIDALAHAQPSLRKGSISLGQATRERLHIYSGRQGRRTP